MSTYGRDTSSSTSSSTWYDNSSHSPFASGELRVEKAKPLSHLVEKERLLKEDKDEPSGGMPKGPILFDPKELVL